MTLDEALTEARFARSEVIMATAALNVAVVKARLLGATWIAIGSATGTSRQAATERFLPLEIEARARLVEKMEED